jgi:hypothetical protein
MLPPGGAKALLEAQVKAQAAEATNTPATPNSYRNVKVNQDRNPWPKTDIASAVDPSNPTGWLVMALDYRVNWSRMFYHVSTTRGKTWTDDMLVEGSDPNTGYIPLTFQTFPGVSFDGVGNSYYSALSQDAIVDFNNNYINVDTLQRHDQWSFRVQWNRESADEFDGCKQRKPERGNQLRVLRVLLQPSVRRHVHRRHGYDSQHRHGDFGIALASSRRALQLSGIGERVADQHAIRRHGHRSLGHAAHLL